MEVKLPNLLVVGTQRSGTTSLYHYLRQHPEVFMPSRKEPRFFVSSIYRNIDPGDPYCMSLRRNSIYTLEDYAKLFEDVTTERAIGEASTEYLYYYDTVIPQIKRFLGDVKIVAILRDPVDRAFSAYTHVLREQFEVLCAEKPEVLSFERCLELEEERRRANWAPINFFKDLGFYYKQVKAYVENFSAVKIFLYDDLTREALGLMKDAYDFLEVDPSFVPDVTVRHNISGVPKSLFFHRLVNFLTRSNALMDKAKPMARVMLPKETRARLFEDLIALKVKNLAKPEMKPETREYLKNAYRDDLLRLQDLIDRDLSRWLS
jgi:hypothetical protein